MANSRPIPALVIPSRITLIWEGSPLRDKHKERAILWKKLNPDYEVIVQCNKQFKSDIELQLKDQGIVVNSVEDTALSVKVLDFIKAVVNYKDEQQPDKVNNRSVPSDLRRFYFLKKGGWYVDTDITPTDLSKISINPKLGIIFNSTRIGDQINKLEPSVIACSENNLLIDKALEFIEPLCEMINNRDYINLLNNKAMSVRMNATMLTTGNILRVALSKLIVDGKPILHLWDDKDNFIPDVKLYDSLIHQFEGFREQSWLFSKFELDEKDPTRISAVTHKGVTLDCHYKNPANYSYSFPTEAKLVDGVTDKLVHLCSKISSVNLDSDKMTQKEIVVTKVNLFPSVNLPMNDIEVNEVNELNVSTKLFNSSN